MKKRRGAGRGKPGTGPKLLLAIVTCVNLILTLLLAVMDTLRAIQGEDRLKLLLERTGKKE